MAVLPDWEIRQRCETNFGFWDRRLIQDFDEELLQPSSYDVKLAPEILIPSSRHTHAIDTRLPAEDRMDRIKIDSDHGFMLRQGVFVLAATQEWVNIHTDLVGRIEGKSSRARQGIQIHSAGYLDPGFRGNVTLEIVNFSPDVVLLWPDVLIAQLSFEKLTDHCEASYGQRGNHYQNSKGAIGSRFGR